MRTRLNRVPLTTVLVVCLLLTGVPILAADSEDFADTPAVASAEPVCDRLSSDVQESKEKADEDGNVVVVVKLEGTSLVGIRQDRVVAELRQHATLTQKGILDFLARRDAHVLNTFWLTNAVLARVPVGLLNELARQPGVERLFENFTLTIPDPQDGGRHPEGLSEEHTWGLEMIRVPEVWDMLGATGSGVRVAVSDTGVDMGHPDLAGKMWTDDPFDPTYPGGWIEFDGMGNIVPGSTPYDTASHGTHCSGTVLGGADSGIAIGVAPDAILMHALILPGGGGTFAQVIAGMQWSVAPFDQYGDPAGEPAHVHSMSWGAGGYHDAMIEPIENMRAAGVVPVASTGNSGDGSSGSPGNVYQSFGIGATDVNDDVAGRSSGEVIDWPASHPEPYIKPDFSAPGVGVYSSVPGGYGYMSGTSMAAPHAAGTVALMLAANPTLTVDKIYEILKDTAVWYDRYYPEAPCTRYGWGRIDAFEAVAVAALDSGIEGVVTDADSGDPLEGAKVVVAETGQTRHTDASGSYRFYLLPGSYNVTASAFGYYEGTAMVEVVEDEFATQDYALERMPSGFIEGTVRDSDTHEPVEGAVITLLNTPLSTSTDQDGWYSIQAPVGTHDVRAWAWGYKSAVRPDVAVPEDDTVTVDLDLEPTLVVAVLGDYNSQLTNLLIGGDISAEERGWDVIHDMGDYDAVVVNRPYDPGEEIFLEFLDAASDNEVGVVFTSSWPVEWEPYGISLLQWHLGDPAGQGDTYGQGHVYYRVTEAHPIFDGWHVGDTITIIDSGDRDYAWFWDYSGYTIADIGSEYAGIQGNAVALNVYGKSLHVLLAGLAPQWYTNLPHWTEDAKTIFINAVAFAALDSGIEGYVTDEDTEAPLEGAKVWVNETGQAAYADETGFYRLYLPPGSYTVTAQAFGYYESSVEGVEVVEDVFTPQDFALGLLPSGFIEGTVTGVDTGDPVEGAIVTLLGTPAGTTTDEHGNYSIKAPEGTYDVRAWAWGYWSSIEYDVSVTVDQTVPVNFDLEPGLVVAVLGDYWSQLTDLLMDNDISVHERDWDIIYDMGDYHVVVVNRPYDPGEETFLEFLEAASDNGVGVVFTSSVWPQWESYGISLLQRHLGDPAGQDYTWTWVDVYYHVTESNPIFEGWDVGDTITVFEAAQAQLTYAWFWDYSGYTIGEVGHWYTVPWGDASEEPIPAPAGDAVALNAYGDSLHVLLASLAPQSYTNLMHWTEDARTIFIRGVLVAGGHIDLDLVVATTGLPTGVVGEDYHASVSAIGGTRPYDWNIVDGTLPPGLDFDAETGVISGTPTEVGTFAFTIEVTDDAQDTAIRELFITVIEWTEFITDPIGDQFDGYGPDIVGLDYHRTEDTIYFRVRTATAVDPYGTANAMFLDLDLNPATGYVSDDPYVPTNDIGADAVALVGWPWWVYNEAGDEWSLPIRTISQDRKFEMEPPQAFSASLSGELYLWHPWYEYFYYVGSFPVFAGTHHFWFAIPLDMLDDDGIMSVVDVIGYRWEPTDVAPNEGHGLTTTPLEINTTKLPAGQVGVPYEATLEAAGGVPPYTWAIISIDAGNGLTLDPLTGVISGTPTIVGTFHFTVQVIDATKEKATAELSITILESLEILTTELPTGQVGVPYEATLEAAGGVPPYTWAITTIAGGSGLSLDPRTGSISGTPTTVGTFSFTVQVVDARKETATADLSITIMDELPANPVRDLPAMVMPGAQFAVTVTWTAPADDFHGIVLFDAAPTSWTVEVDKTWCTPEALTAKINEDNEAEYAWMGPYAEGTEFTAVYKVTVPLDVEQGPYTFDGSLLYYIEPDPADPYEPGIIGDVELLVLEGAKIYGTTYEVVPDVLPGATISLYKGEVLQAETTSDEDGNYEILATETGMHRLIASKDGFRDEIREMDIADLGREYLANFAGDHGLIPNELTGAYFSRCISVYLFREDRFALSGPKFARVMSAYLNPV